jgi:thiol:disulfide interchange protein
MTYVTRFLFTLLATLLLATGAIAQSHTAKTDHAALELLVSSDLTWAAIEFELEEDWHIYWQNPGDSGLDAQIKWELPDGVQAGPIHWLPPKRIEYSGLFNYGYEGKTALLIPLKTDGEPSGAFSADVEFLICADVCIPQEASRSASPTPTSDERIAKWRTKLPKLFKGRAEYDITPDGVFFAFDLLDTEIGFARIYHAWWFPIDDQTISNASEQQWRLDGSVLILNADREGSKTPAPFSGLLEVATTDGQKFYYHIDAKHVPVEGAPIAEPMAETVAETPSAPSAAEMTLLVALLSAFLGGIVLNIMPCVLPVLSLKALSIAKKSNADRSALRMEGIAYTAGIILTFVAVAGALIVLQQAGAHSGWGFQLQSVGFVAALIYLLFLIGLNLSGMFELPSSFAGVGSGLTQKSGPSGSFFTGVLATIVATPCTAPFMAGAIGFALSQSAMVALLIFVALGLGLAFPFLLITFIPGATRFLPKPGAWMERFKQFLAFPIYATVIWLLWVLVQQAGPMGLLHVMGAMLLIGFTLWLLQQSQTRLTQLIFIAIGAFGVFWLTQDVRTAPPSMQEAMPEQVEPFSNAGLQQHLDAGRTVFVNATAAWCITCKVNERVALVDKTVQQTIKDQNIVYMVADWTNRNAEISDYLASFGRSGVPMYVFYAPNQAPLLLPQILTPSILLETFQTKP